MSADSAPSSAVPTLFPRELQRVGKFDFLMRLGQGGMATVYLARTVSTGGFQRLVAIKLMHQFLGADEQFVEMFLDEARVAANIRHPNVVSIVDLGSDADHLYMVMDYVEGDTLAAVEGTAAKLGRAIPLGVVLRIILDALAGLDAAHELKTPDGVDLKVVHRDVSPQNILVGVDGAARLTDFGIARAEQRIASTRTGMLKGKAPFMAPEQFEGRPVDRRADVFAMGVTLWEAVALRRLFPGRESYEQAVRNARAPYRRLREILPTVPESLDAIVRKALAHDPNDRYPTAAAFADALEAEFRSILASHRQVGAFMSAVASEKIQRERDAVRKAPKPQEDTGTRNARSPRSTAFGLRRPDSPISASAMRAFDSRPPEKIPSIPPANDTRHDDDDPEVAAALLALQEMPDGFGADLPARRSSPHDEMGLPRPVARHDEHLPALTRHTPTRAASHPVRRARSSTLLGQGSSGARNSPPPRLRSTVTGAEMVALARQATPQPRAPIAPPPATSELEVELPRPRKPASARSLLAPPRPPSAAPNGMIEPTALDLPAVTPRPHAPSAQTSMQAAPVPHTPVPSTPAGSPSSTLTRGLGQGYADSTIEFDLVNARRREPGDAKNSLNPHLPLTNPSRPVDRVRTDVRKPATPSLQAPQAPTEIAPPTVSGRPMNVARFPSLVPSPRASVFNNRWVSGAVVAAVLGVVIFVLTRGL